MRSDQEEIPAPFTKADADKAETMEARQRMARVAAGCQVYWPSPYEVCGAIKDKYNSLGGPGSFLSFPNSPELTNPGNTGARTQFLNGPIYWSGATGAHPVVNSFLNRWGVHGYEGGWLKYPTTDEIVLPDGGRRQEFQFGAIYVAFQNAVGSAIKNGAIRDKWNTVGGAAPGGSFLGYPIGDEIGLPGGQGAMVRFQNGVIYWHPSHGARVVSGTILQDWAAAGYESGTYGFPTADAVQTSDIWYEQQFQNGKIAGTIVINRGLYWPLMSVDKPTMPGDNYESDVLPCMEYEMEADQPLAVFKVRGVAAPIFLYCGRFRTHMAPNPAVSGDPGHFSNYPPTRKDWYDFLGCTFYTFNGENYPNVDSGNFGRQRGNVSSGVNSVSVGNEPSGTFVTGWAGQNQYSSQWSGCVQGLAMPWE
ncbi:LGFP repeat-containing protein [Antrihabitans sp. YC3-6]|uniref:LGFP repeat-containing protein n=2 Tax=Antrihabitans stalagmiti TaxID=2799499 RepID=A0A934U3G5_9NOCA|nr:LGFP repeat-containing protein [Antrihabitans stalagmiti]